MGNELSLSQADLQAGPAAVRARLRSGVNPNKRMLFPQDVGPLPKGCKCTPLGFAILSWSTELLDSLLAAGADPRKPVGLPARFDFSPLQLAVALGFAAGVRRLLDAGADANAPLQLKRGTTAPPPLPPAAVSTSSYQENISLLPHHRSSYRPRASANQGSSAGGGGTSSDFNAAAAAEAIADAPVATAAEAAATVAVASPQPQLLLPDCLARARPGDAPLHIAIDCAAESGAAPAAVGGCRMEVVEALIGHPRADLNRRNARGRTPLYKACKRRIEVFVALLATHPRVDVNTGAPLFAAVKTGSPDLVRALLHAGASPNVVLPPSCSATDADAACRTPLAAAVRLLGGAQGGGGFEQRRLAEVAALLVQAGAHVDPELVLYAQERAWEEVLVALLSGDSAGPGARAAAAAATGGGAGGGGVRQRPRHAAGVRVATAVSSLAALAAVATARMSPRQRANTELGSFGQRQGSGAAGGGGGGSIIAAGAGGNAGGGGGDGTGSRGSSVVATGAGGRRGVSVSTTGTTSRTGRAGGGSGWRFSFCSPSRRARPPLLFGQMCNNPIMVLFLPVLFPIIIIEAVAVTIGEVLQAVLAALLCVVAFFTPAALYGVYRAVRWVALMAFAAVSPHSSFSPHAHEGGLIGAAGGAGSMVERGGRLGGAGSGDGAVASLPLRDALPLPLIDGAAPSLDSLRMATALPAAAPSMAECAACTSLDSTPLATAAAAAAAGAPSGAVQCGPVGLLRECSGPASAGVSQGASSGGGGGGGGGSRLCAAFLDGAADQRGGLDGLEDAVQLRNPPPSLHQPEASCASGASDAATAASPAAPDPAVPASAFSDEGSVINGRSLTSLNGAGSGSGSVGSVMSFVARLPGMLWRAYVGLILAFAATLLAVVAVRMACELMETAARGLLPAGGSELGAFLHARARSASSSAASQRESNLTACLLVAAVALRWFGGASFWTLLRLVAAGWVVVEAVEFGLEFRQLRRSNARRDGGTGGSSASAPEPRIVEVGSGAGSDGSGGAAAAAATAAAAANAPAADIRGATAAALAAAVAASSGGDGVSGGLDGMCCVCMSSRAVMGFVHPDVVHCCMCVGCEVVLRSRGSTAKCLICKRPAMAVAKVVAT